ncbi:hypothetical protein HQ545_02500 [Candidatus Woesearchaeota archaeon]|nr:hypothetical protein [Candidatus Woesearchaeota archaeon]
MVDLTHKEALSLLKKHGAKLRDSTKRIVLNKRQVSTKNPAIAQLWIEFPEAFNSQKMNTYFNNMKQEYSIDADFHEIKQVDEKTFCIELRGFMLMYKWMDHFISNFRIDFRNQGYNVVVSGEWDRYG